MLNRHLPATPSLSLTHIHTSLKIIQVNDYYIVYIESNDHKSMACEKTFSVSRVDTAQPSHEYVLV